MKTIVTAFTSGVLKRSYVSWNIVQTMLVGAICILAQVNATSAQQVIYQDNFQSATNGQSIFAAPVNFQSGGVQGGGNFTLDNTTPFGPALAVDRPNPDDYGVARYPVASFTPTTGMHIILTAQIYDPVVNSNDAWIGFNKSSIGAFNNAGAYLGVGNIGNSAIFAVDLRGVGGAEDDFTPAVSAPLLGKIVTATLDYNVSSGIATYFFTDGTHTISNSQSGLNFSGIDYIAINETSHNTQSLMYVGALQAAQVTLPTLPGDISHDSQVNLADYSILTSHWFQTVTVGTNGDLNLDGQVNLADFKLFKADYNGGGGLSAPVPEPASLVLTAIAVPMIYATIARRRACSQRRRSRVS